MSYVYTCVYPSTSPLVRVGQKACNEHKKNITVGTEIYSKENYRMSRTDIKVIVSRY